MDSRRFDSLARSLAVPRTRRGILGGAAALAAGLLGLRAAEAGPQAQCGNVLCASNPGICNDSCVCCVYSNGNSRCRPPGQCTGSGTITCPAGTQFCTVTESCTECCGDLACDDGIACTVDVCDGGVCTNTPNDDLCLSGQICDPVQGCVCPAGTKFCPNSQSCAECCTIDDPVCEDGIACTVDECILGVCHHTPSTALCPIGQVCNGELGCVCPPFQTLVNGECVDSCLVVNCVDQACPECAARPDGTADCLGVFGACGQGGCTSDDQCPVGQACYKFETDGPCGVTSSICAEAYCNP